MDELATAALALAVLWVPLTGVFIWVFSIWAAAGVAENKGRSPWFGSLLGTFFGPVGLGLTWMAPANEAEVEWRRSQRALTAQPPGTRD